MQKIGLTKFIIQKKNYKNTQKSQKRDAAKSRA